MDRNKNINRVTLIGSLGKDPQIFSSNFENRDVCVLWLVSQERQQDRDGNIYETIDWTPIVAWGVLGEESYKYFSYGDIVYVEGRLYSRNAETLDGSVIVITEVIADRCILLHPDTNDPADGVYVPEDSSGIVERYIPPSMPDPISHFMIIQHW